MAVIELTGKYAIGEHRYAIVDDDMVTVLSQWRWKAKPNGGNNNMYAVRNVCVNGKNMTLRMHRVVLGLTRDDGCEVDHLNHNGIDNRRANLTPTTRSGNMLNARYVSVTGKCQHCGSNLQREVSACAKGNLFSCTTCIQARKAHAPFSTVHFVQCAECEEIFTGRTSLRRFCSEACRCRARYKRRGSL